LIGVSRRKTAIYWIEIDNLAKFLGAPVASFAPVRPGVLKQVSRRAAP